MGKSLVIVESPTKTRTLKSFLGADYQIEASMGHVRDLPKDEFGVNIEDNFEPEYEIIPERKEVIEKLKSAAKNAESVYIASDPDREGEAIAWHLKEALGLKSPKRIRFNEITRTAVTEALRSPQDLNMNLVNAQQARRVLDRVVGYKLSPLLWVKIRKNLSAGRVQSVAVRLICDREREIEAFVPEEYWSIAAELTPLNRREPFEAKLALIDGEKAEVKNEEQAKSIVDELTGAEYKVSNIAKKTVKRNPPAPFITSTLQQEAARKLNFTANRTMTIAQQLYEGIEMGEMGHVGLITYMRTDSTRVAAEAQSEAREFILNNFGEEYAPKTPRQIKKKGAQDAHEAVRPTSVNRRPDDVAKYLSPDQLKLYKLIWQRFLASQMSQAVFEVTSVDIGAKQFTFRASGSVVKFQGFRAVYAESRDTEDVPEEEKPPLPKLSIGELLKLIKLDPKQHFTEPPPRYTEASLVRALEENGIGRPSTYAAIISTIQQRHYVVKEKGRFKPTPLGCAVTDYLVANFPEILDVKFTASVENRLDEIETGKLEWHKVLSDFYEPFEHALKKAEWGDDNEEKNCPVCGSKMELKSGRFGNYFKCTNPDCKKTLRPKREKIEVIQPRETDQICPNCGRKMVIRMSRTGEFMGCSGYPECKTIISMDPPVGVCCPLCTEGEVLQKTSKRGKKFYGCSRWPECKFVSWDKPIDRKCPKCGSIMVENTYWGRHHGYKCSNKECDYKENASKSETPAG